VRTTTVSGRTETMVLCHSAQVPAELTGHVKESGGPLKVAASLNTLNEKGRTWVRVLNHTAEEMVIPAGRVVGVFQVLGDRDEITPWDQGPPESPLPGRLPPHLEDMYEKVHPEFRESDGWRIERFLSAASDVFSRNEEDIGRTTLVQHEIPTKPGFSPIRQPPRRMGGVKDAEVDRQVEELHQRGLIEPAYGAWSSPVVLVKKKDGKWRFCVDYRKLNEATVQDAYPLPRIDESLDALAGSKVFSTLDLVSGYWQVPLSEEAQEKSAFATRSGLWKWKVLPFGLTSAPATFQRLMERVFRGLHWRTLLLYLDDVIVVAPDVETHLQRLQEVFDRLRAAGLKLKPSKCELFQQQVRYLGHVVSKDGVSTDPDKVAAMAEWPAPRDQKELLTFLGMTGYYRQFVKGYANIARPLHRLSGKGVPWEWTGECQQAFLTLRDRLVSAPILCYPSGIGAYVLDTDASDASVGAVLSQEQADGREGVISYFSKALNGAERNYCTTRKELLAVVRAVKHFRPYLYGRKFRIRTDHASLIWLLRQKEQEGQVARWIELLSEFDFEIAHRPGAKHGNADAMSRRPCGAECRQCLRIDKGLQVSVLSALAQEQAASPGAVGQVYHSLKDEAPLEQGVVAQGSWELRRLHARRHALFLDGEGVVRLDKGEVSARESPALCPEGARQGIIQAAHQQRHGGIDQTLQRVRMKWFWPGMTAQVRRLVQDCATCQATKHGGLRAMRGQRRLLAGRPWQWVAIDLVGPLTRTVRGHAWLLVVSDHFTRWCDAIPIVDATAPTVARALDERVFCYMGLPEQLHSDQGANFQSDLFKELCQLWRVDQTRTTPYHPQGNGVVERNNRALGDSLRAALRESGQSEWDDLVPQIMRAIRSTPHALTGETPNFMAMGREARVPDTILHESPATDPLYPSAYVGRLVENMREAHEVVRDRQDELRQEDGEEEPLFSVGDLVWLEVRAHRRGTTAKLQPKFEGPYRVKTVHRASLTYRIEKGTRGVTVNECRLKRFRGEAPATEVPATPARAPPPPPPAESEESSDEEDLAWAGGYAFPQEPPASPGGAEAAGGREEPVAGPSRAEGPITDTPVRAPPDRPRRVRRFPARYQDFQCDALRVSAVEESVKYEGPAVAGCTAVFADTTSPGCTEEPLQLVAEEKAEALFRVRKGVASTPVVDGCSIRGALARVRAGPEVAGGGRVLAQCQPTDKSMTERPALREAVESPQQPSRERLPLSRRRPPRKPPSSVYGGRLRVHGPFQVGDEWTRLQSAQRLARRPASKGMDSKRASRGHSAFVVFLLQ